MPKVDLNGISVNYQLEGEDGDLVVLVNGLADDLQTWDYQVPALLKAGYRILRYDNRGIGQTSRPPGPYTAPQLATDLYSLLQHLSIGPFHLLGVSMGAMVGQAYALQYLNGSTSSTSPHMLSLSLCCTYAQPTVFCTRMFALWADMAQRMSVQDVMRDVTLWAFTVPFFRARTKELEEVEEAMRQLDMSLESYLAQLNVIQVFDTTDALAKVASEGAVLGGLSEGEVMVLAGDEDILIPVQLSKELQSSIKGAVWKTSRGGHGCMWEFPDEFNEIMVRFLNTHRS